MVLLNEVNILDEDFELPTTSLEYCTMVATNSCIVSLELLSSSKSLMKLSIFEIILLKDFVSSDFPFFASFPPFIVFKIVIVLITLLIRFCFITSFAKFCLITTLDWVNFCSEPPTRIAPLSLIVSIL